MCAIELQAFATLRDAGGISGEARASSKDDLMRYLQAGLLFAAFDGAGAPIGFGGGFDTDGWLHIAELDMDPNWQRRGIGRRLMGALLGEGQKRGYLGATLTTDRLVPFNAPFYASLGFRAAEESTCPIHLVAILASDTAAAACPYRRVAMLINFPLA